jgi:hypothetical protein
VYATLIERDRIPVVMCTWKRIEQLPRTLELLAVQDTPVSLYVWNNNRRQAERLDALLTKSPIPAHSVHCVRNIGCFGRFYLARDLAPVHEAVIFIDDDQLFDASMVSDQLRSFSANSLAGWWAFTYPPGAPSYDTRDRVEAPLGEAEYVGVGGMIADSSIFADPSLFGCPRRYWFVDDLWLSFYARQVRGWQLRRSYADFVFDQDEHDLYLALGATKRRMFRYLKRRGWSVGSAVG